MVNKTKLACTVDRDMLYTAVAIVFLDVAVCTDDASKLAAHG